MCYWSAFSWELSRMNKTKILAEFMAEDKKKLVPCRHIFGCNDISTLVSFATKKQKVVLVLSTLHGQNKLDDETVKSIQVMDYNGRKGGVDTVDFVCSRISTFRRTKRWPMTVFF
ncbi:uncharacterized protein LOC124613265 [Schistocerca americana]|uniref:uncharacterized protein LOC124613265 n=1 Tax=Schistocerca americana TaxID=7009 RepID=UPI001F4FB48B|nr:uncharacterized protein LOC124613265 [Schistocerca americana]